MAPFTLATAWQVVQPMEIAVWTYFPVALSLDTQAFGGIYIGGEKDGDAGEGRLEQKEAKSNKMTAVKVRKRKTKR